ncbi:MAG: rhomboid family intramembrane serine protease [Brevundimonas sp.]|uniref:rhomboid family intramembrane serine protease n=1 Tax=Brevundimonas sp. TaxID=1871086 RepID=UPI001221F98F|nr:rhomboid family intramembrane serine protease [Brevundimonas sp.]RZJ16526.1 MAG: rhomboid family intramembrane serine protease [Brevundimonas sp.]
MEPYDSRLDGPPREKIFNAPLIAVLVALSMPVLFLGQLRLADFGMSLAFRPSDLAAGHWGELFTSMLLHRNWGHVGMNAVGAFAFGPPVARLLRGGWGVIAFLALYVGGGVVGALGYGLLHLNSWDLLVGASGAVFALIGAATRLLGGQGGVLPLTDRRVLSAAAAWMLVNAAVGLIGFAPGAEGGRIAWEAHAFGFVFGILVIGPLGRIFGARAGFASMDRMSDPEA